MARADNNLFTQFTRGAVGKELVFKVINNKTFVCKYPDMSQVAYNEAQLEYRKIFANAARYASSVLKDPEKKARYLRKGLNADMVYHAALKDYMKLHSGKKSGNGAKKNFKKLLDLQELNERQVKAVQYLIKKGQLTNAIYQQINGVSKATATRDLQRLVQLTVIKPAAAKGAGARYTLADTGHPEK